MYLILLSNALDLISLVLWLLTWKIGSIKISDSMTANAQAGDRVFIYDQTGLTVINLLCNTYHQLVCS